MNSCTGCELCLEWYLLHFRFGETLPSQREARGTPKKVPFLSTCCKLCFYILMERWYYSEGAALVGGQIKVQGHKTSTIWFGYIRIMKNKLFLIYYFRNIRRQEDFKHKEESDLKMYDLRF